MESSLKVVSLTFLIVMVTVVACELNMTSSSQTTSTSLASALFDCDSSTCVEFIGQGYTTDLLVWLPEPVAWSTSVSLIGTDLLCGAHDQGRLYVVPSTTLEPMGLVSTCRLMSATTEGQLDVCTFSCQDTAENTTLKAVRVIRRPYQPSHGDWTLCGVDVCPAGYSWACNYCGHCYHYNPTRMTWDDARQYCTSTHQDAYMVEVNSMHENDCVYELSRSIGSYTWLGGRFLSGAWTWTHSGQNLSEEYQAWIVNETMGCMVGFTTERHWYDRQCSRNYTVVCEYGK